MVLLSFRFDTSRVKHLVDLFAIMFAKGETHKQCNKAGNLLLHVIFYGSSIYLLNRAGVKLFKATNNVCETILSSIQFSIRCLLYHRVSNSMAISYQKV